MACFMYIGIGLSSALGVWVLLEPNKSQLIRSSYRAGSLAVALAEFSRTADSFHLEAFDVPEVFALPAYELVWCFTSRGYVLSYDAAIVLAAGVTLVCMLSGAIIATSVIGLVVGAVVGLAGLYFWAGSAAKKRSLDLASQVPDMYRSLSAALSSGRTLAQAISYVGSGGTRLLEREFARCSLMVSCGVSAVEALQDLPKRVNVPGIELMITALSVSARTGAPLQSLFTRSAALVERRFELERELSTKTAQVRLSARLVSALPAAMVALLALLSPDFKEGLAHPIGAGCVAVAVILDVAALFIIRRMMKGVL